MLIEVATFRFFYRFMKTKEKAKDAVESLAVVSALLLTMVGISSSGITGDKMAGVDEDLVSTVYTVLAFISLSCFFFSTILSVFALIFIAFLENDGAFLVWLGQCGRLFTLKLIVFNIVSRLPTRSLSSL